ncbi:GNAT family N-acetyltransferase [Microbacterium sp. cf332]|uniref:GNAT family N-acetyltransferase n=1 Tax=Microbacterium sp. cf332 TaxID=1761804 RepID=UPI000891EBBE|nr:GNAT family N-acetyltransferase [Microbacterium sp. cf332]SDQ58552.1 Ribosomal protein S18 acetylase RimI and related acetyltransferases [Microbacterium sp. cf332]
MTSTATALTIRLVRTEEFDRAGELTARAYQHSYGGLSGHYLASLRDVAVRVQSGDVWVAVDAAAGDLLGTVWVARPNRPLADIAQPGETDFRQLAVAPEARGRGVGEALTRHVIELARERGSHRVVMNSGPEMTAAHALYAKLGFTRLTEREGRIEVEPGRFIELLAFGYDLEPLAAAPSATTGPAPTWLLEEVDYADARAVALRAEMDREVGPRYADRFDDADPEAAARSARAFAIDPATIVATVLVTDAAGTAVGHGALRDLAHDGTRDLEIKRVFVHQRARGLGASRALLAELERIARDRGASRVILQTGDRQHDAVVLYERLGYTPIPIYAPYTEYDFSRCFAKAL